MHKKILFLVIFLAMGFPSAEADPRAFDTTGGTAVRQCGDGSQYIQHRAKEKASDGSSTSIGQGWKEGADRSGEYRQDVSHTDASGKTDWEKLRQQYGPDGSQTGEQWAGNDWGRYVPMPTRSEWRENPDGSAEMNVAWGGETKIQKFGPDGNLIDEKIVPGEVGLEGDFGGNLVGQCLEEEAKNPEPTPEVPKSAPKPEPKKEAKKSEGPPLGKGNAWRGNISFFQRCEEKREDASSNATLKANFNVALEGDPVGTAKDLNASLQKLFSSPETQQVLASDPEGSKVLAQLQEAEQQLANLPSNMEALLDDAEKRMAALPAKYHPVPLPRLHTLKEGTMSYSLGGSSEWNEGHGYYSTSLYSGFGSVPFEYPLMVKLEFPEGSKGEVYTLYFSSPRFDYTIRRTFYRPDSEPAKITDEEHGAFSFLLQGQWNPETKTITGSKSWSKGETVGSPLDNDSAGSEVSFHAWGVPCNRGFARAQWTLTAVEQ